AAASVGAQRGGKEDIAHILPEARPSAYRRAVIFLSVSVFFLGEAIVDLVCERPVAGFAEADSFVPHCGGAGANAAVVASRCGADVSLGGGVGDDPWGAWLEQRLRAEGERLHLLARVSAPLRHA